MVELLPDPSVVIEMNQVTAQFWEAARQRRFTIPRCSACGRFHMPPAPLCPYCRWETISFPTLSGRGTIYSFTIIHPSPKVTPTPPLDIIGLVEIAEADGCRLFTRFVDVSAGDVAIGMPVEVRWQEVANGWLVPRFGRVR
jgi:uncharacterized OB-fold protein